MVYIDLGEHMVAPAILAAIIGGLSSITGGFLNRSKGNESKIQRKQRGTIDDLLASLKGNGPYSDLLNFDENTFNKSYVEPAKARFANQIAPQIQQSYIASGQQRGSGMDDQLLRAGVDLDQMLNQQYASMQQGAQNNKMSFLQNILGAGSGGQQGQSAGNALQESAAGYLGGDSYKELINQLFGNTNQPELTQPNNSPRKGFES